MRVAPGHLEQDSFAEATPSATSTSSLRRERGAKSNLPIRSGQCKLLLDRGEEVFCIFQNWEFFIYHCFWFVDLSPGVP